MPQKPICAVLLPDSTKKQCFSEEDWDRLGDACSIQFAKEGAMAEMAPEAMKDAHIVLTGWGACPLTAEVLEPAPDLKLWMHSAGSMAGFVSEALWERDLIYSTCNDVLARGVAEYTLALTVMSLKQAVPLYQRIQETRSWKGARGSKPVRELCNMTVGLLGFGRVARHLADLLTSFRGLDLVVADPYVSEEILSSHQARRGAM